MASAPLRTGLSLLAGTFTFSQLLCGHKLACLIHLMSAVKLLSPSMHLQVQLSMLW